MLPPWKKSYDKPRQHIKRHWQRKLKIIGRNGKIVHAFRFKELMLLKWPYYTKQSTNLMWSLSKSCQLCIPFGFPDSSVGMESTCNARDPGSIPGSGWCAGEGIGYSLQYSWASLVAQLVKNVPSMQETCVWSLGWEDPLEREWPPTPVFWPGEFHGLYSPLGSQRVGCDWVTFTLKILMKLFFFFRTRTNNPKIYMKP